MIDISVNGLLVRIESLYDIDLVNDEDDNRIQIGSVVQALIRFGQLQVKHHITVIIQSTQFCIFIDTKVLI